MTPPTRNSYPEGDALLRPFRFQGLEVRSAQSDPESNSGSDGRCDVLCDLDFAGTSRSSLVERLSAARQRIRSSGILLLGVPNRFGLRFWSGAPEPRSGRLFETLVGPAAARTPIAWMASRQELKEALACAGLTALEWFFATPDSIGTSGGSLISERMVAAAPEVASDLAAARPHADLVYPRVDLLPEALVSREIARAGLFAELANHFLVAVTAAPAAAAPSLWPRLRPPAPEVGWHYAAARREPIVTVFELEAGQLTVSKRQCNGGTAHESSEFCWEAQRHLRRAPGEPFRLILEEHLVAGRSALFLRDFGSFFEFIRARFGRDPELAGEALDAITRNATRDEHGAFHLFDLEWRARSGVPLSWWILRNVLSCIEMRGTPIPDLPHAGALYEALCVRLGVEPQLAADLAREAALGVAVRPAALEEEVRALAGALERTWPVPVAAGMEASLFGVGADLATAHQRLSAEYQRLESWVAQMQTTQASAAEEHRRLEAWAKHLESELQKRDRGVQP